MTSHLPRRGGFNPQNLPRGYATGWRHLPLWSGNFILNMYCYINI